MPDWTQQQVQRIDKYGRARPIEYRAIDVSGDGDMKPGERIPIVDRAEKTRRASPYHSTPMQAHSRDPHTYRIPPGELPGGVGCRHAGALRAWRAVRSARGWQRCLRHPGQMASSPPGRLWLSAGRG